MLVTFIFGIGKCVTILLPIFFYHNSAGSLPSLGLGRVVTPSAFKRFYALDACLPLNFALAPYRPCQILCILDPDRFRLVVFVSERHAIYSVLA